jgi:hypothetical protein
VRLVDIWSSAPVAFSPIRPESQIFNIGHGYPLWIRNFMVMMKKSENLDFETPRPKSQNSNIRLDGILPIRNFMLMINNHFVRFQLPGNLLKTKKNVLFISVATRNFLFISLCSNKNLHFT